MSDKKIMYGDYELITSEKTGKKYWSKSVVGKLVAIQDKNEYEDGHVDAFRYGTASIIAEGGAFKGQAADFKVFIQDAVMEKRNPVEGKSYLFNFSIKADDPTRRLAINCSGLENSLEASASDFGAMQLPIINADGTIDEMVEQDVPTEEEAL